MPTDENKRRLTAIGMFVLPIVLVKAAGVMLSPATVEATTPDPVDAVPQPVVTQSAPVQATDAELAAARHLSSLLDKPFGPTPLFYETGETAPPVIAEDPFPGDGRPMPEFMVKAILASSRGNTALIDGKAYRVGDILEVSGWVVDEIDVHKRSVTIRDPETGRSETRTVQSPR